jgi:fatty-acid desaturase
MPHQISVHHRKSQNNEEYHSAQRRTLWYSLPLWFIKGDHWQRHSRELSHRHSVDISISGHTTPKRDVVRLFLRRITMFAYREFTNKSEELLTIKVLTVIDQLKKTDKKHIYMGLWAISGALALGLWVVIWLAF